MVNKTLLFLLEDNPTTVEIMVKRVWNELGREERKAIMNAQKSTFRGMR